MLSGILRKQFTPMHSLPLGQAMPNYINTFDESELFQYKYNKYFNEYSWELTISPKSSPELIQEECCACGARGLLTIEQQTELLYKLIKKIIINIKINILGTIELYNDKKHIHTHCIINNMSKHKEKKLRKLIKEYYNLDNQYVVNIKSINNYNRYKEYLIKDSYEYYSYHELEKHDEDMNTHQEILEKEKQQRIIDLHNIYEDPIKLHIHECIFKSCPICIWIKTRGSNVKQAKGSLDAK